MTLSDPPADLIPTRPTQRDDVVFRELSGDWVLFDPETQRLHILNLAAALVWTFCDGTRNLEGLADELSGAFESSPPREEVVEQAREALAQLHREGLFR